MHVTIEPKDFYEIDYDTDVQNLSENANFFYVESVGQPVLTNGYLTNGFTLKPLDIFRFLNDSTENCWLYNPSHVAVRAQV